MAGIPLAALPQYWRPYASQAANAWEVSTQRVLPLLARGGEAAVQLTAVDGAEIVIRGGESSLRLAGELLD